MSNSQKYTLNVQQKDNTWMAAIHRRLSKDKSRISLKKGDFPTEEAATKWGETELKRFQAHQTQLNLQRSVDRGEKRRQKEKAAEDYAARRGEQSEGD